MSHDKGNILVMVALLNSNEFESQRGDKKLLAPHIHDIRPTQYLLETQVFIVLYHCCPFAFFIL
jgi:hypothetical protein